MQGTPTPTQPGDDKAGAVGPLPLDIPALRVQLAGSYILEALRLHRTGKRQPVSQHLVPDAWDMRADQ